MIQRLELSELGLNLIMKYTSCRLNAHQSDTGLWTVGYNHVEGVTPETKISHREAIDLLIKDCKPAVDCVNSVFYNPVTNELDQNQFDALVSFTFSCGRLALQKLCEGRKLEQIPHAMLKYDVPSLGADHSPRMMYQRTEESMLMKKDLYGFFDTVTDYKTKERLLVTSNCLAFQRAVNADKTAFLAEDGKLGELTKSVIFRTNLSAGYDKVTGTYRIGSYGEVVRFVQARLGIIETGQFEAGTRNAVIAWQKDHDLEPDGICGSVTLMSMM